MHWGLMSPTNRDKASKFYFFLGFCQDLLNEKLKSQRTISPKVSNNAYSVNLSEIINQQTILRGQAKASKVQDLILFLFVLFQESYH